MTNVATRFTVHPFIQFEVGDYVEDNYVDNAYTVAIHGVLNVDVHYIIGFRRVKNISIAKIKDLDVCTK